MGLSKYNAMIFTLLGVKSFTWTPTHLQISSCIYYLRIIDVYLGVALSHFNIGPATQIIVQTSDFHF